MPTPAMHHRALTECEEVLCTVTSGNASAWIWRPGWIPELSLALVEASGGADFAAQEAGPLVAAQEPPELWVAVTGVPLHHALEIAIEHRHPTDSAWWPRHPVRGAGEHVIGRCPHEVLTEAVALAAGPPILVAGSHRAQVDETQVWLVPGDCNPAELPTAVAIDAVPHQLVSESIYLPKTDSAVELAHPR